MFTRHALNCACGKKAWFYCACQRKWLRIVIYNESGALTTWQSAFFSWSRWVRVATKAFWKHLWETPSQTCISFCGTAVLAWCEPSLELCLRSVNSKDNGAQSCLAPLQYSNLCVSIVFSKLHKGFLHSCHLQSRQMSHVFLYKLHRRPNVWRD